MPQATDTLPTQNTGEIAPPSPPIQSNMRSEIIIRIITAICRMGLGAVFIVSGVAKAIDPWGTIYKMQDYIAALPSWLCGWALPLLTPGSFLLFIFEALIGMALLTGSYRRIAPICATALMAVMLPLTVWIAWTDPVQDCGCFGDALILTNYQTLWKNVVITVGCVWLLIFGRRLRPFIAPPLQWLLIIAGIIYTGFVGFIGYSVQPMIDFRPYPVGAPLLDSEDTEAESEPAMMAQWSDGEHTLTLPADSIPDGEEWEFVDRVTEASADSESQKPVKGLAIYDADGEDITDFIAEDMKSGEFAFIFMRDLPTLSHGNYYKLNSLYEYCTLHHVNMYVVATATPKEIAEYREASLAEYPIYTAEDTAIKEAVRGNPAIIYIKDGKIVYKSSLSAIPVYDFMEGDGAVADSLSKYQPSTTLKYFEYLSLSMLSFIALLMVCSHVPAVIRFASRRRRGSKWIKSGEVAKICIAISVAGALFTSCHKDEPTPQEPTTPSERTILIYMVADNNLDSYAYADIQEMLSGYEQVSHSGTQVLVYHVGLSTTAPTLSRIDIDAQGYAFLHTLKSYDAETPSVSPARIQEVIADMEHIAPAQEYGLVLWSHATGWLPGTISDAPSPQKAFGNDRGRSISIPALAAAIGTDKFSFIWLDCCYMAGIESIYQMRNCADYLVAYPTEILADGAPYHSLLPQLCTSFSNLKQAAYLTYNYYAQSTDPKMQSCTISVIDTSALSRVAEAAHDIVTSQSDEDKSRELIPGTIQSYGTLNNATFYDLDQYLSALTSDKHLISTLHEAISTAVALKYATPHFLYINIDPEHFSGLSCNIPGTEPSTAYAAHYLEYDWYHDVYTE